jgi:hypothetical protein
MPTKSTMTGEQLAEEGFRLSRPCVYLRDKGPKGDLGGVWGGPGILPAPKGEYQHWLSIDCRWYKEGPHHYGHKIGPPAGVMSVYTDEEGGGLVVFDKKAKFAPKKGGKPLYAHPGRSLPPLDGIFQLGSPAVKAWLKENKWKPEWQFNSNFKDKKPAQEYLKRYQDLCPLYGRSLEAHAVLGGWHFPWPDEDWADRVDQPLLVWTFEGSEPWVEVWGSGKKFEVVQRIT